MSDGHGIFISEYIASEEKMRAERYLKVSESFCLG